ncbi:hypothetical protein KP79_PYT03613 [Mizuhopecten yessoensis]|uniref:Uncharacterized protein n=1 Tax=Mizuhopecten yessoensis TaxID=6573 RepID=A0A210PIU9_MIZYE|nr:hypothetical protein KP79_PYT03613 [Mizuhopecten yessoensis]
MAAPMYMQSNVNKLRAGVEKINTYEDVAVFTFVSLWKTGLVQILYPEKHVQCYQPL